MIARQVACRAAGSRSGCSPRADPLVVAEGYGAVVSYGRAVDLENHIVRLERTFGIMCVETVM